MLRPVFDGLEGEDLTPGLTRSFFGFFTMVFLMALFSLILWNLPTPFDQRLHLWDSCTCEGGMGRSNENVLEVDGAKLTDARLAAGLSQQAIAEALKVGHKGTVCRWERGKSRPTDQQIRAMAKLLKTRNFIVNGG